MKSLRIIFLSLAAVFFVGGAVSFAESLKANDMEKATSSVVLCSLALAAPAVAVAKGATGVLGFMGGGLSRSENHLINFLESKGVDRQTLIDYRSEKLRLISAYTYIRKTISDLSGIQVIFDQRDNEVTGITNLHQAKLQKGVNMVVERILIGYGTDAAITDPKLIKAYDSVVSNFPAGLRNGHLIIKQDGSIVQDPIPVCLCGSQADSQAGAGKFDSFQLQTPFVLEEQKQITIELDLPAASFGTNEHHVEIFLLGSKTRVRSGN